MPAHPAARIRLALKPPLLIAGLALLMTFGPMAVDMYLPALTAISVAFNAPQSQVQGSLSAFFLGFGVGQLVWGTLGDRLGRRLPVVAGIMLYGVGCIGCSLAGGIGTLTLWRFVQALGACAGPVLARAMVRDMFGRDRSASVLSLMMLVMGLAPMLAPMVGGHILLFAGWRTIFWVQAGFGVVALIVLLSLPETLPPEARRRERLSGLCATYLQLLRHRRYLGYALASAFIYGGMFAYVSGTPFVYIEIFGVRPENYGFLFAINIVGMIIVNTVNSRIVLRFGTDRLLRTGCILAAATGIGLLLCAVTGWGGLAAIAAMLFLFLAMTGMIAANAMAGAMALFPHAAGTASAFTGMLQFAGGAVAGSAVGWLANGTAIPMAAVICVVALASVAVNVTFAHRDEAAEPRPNSR